jgi:asparagine synthase (glutamine-hydrolysing)
MNSIAGYWLKKPHADGISGLTDRMLKAAPHRGADTRQFVYEDGTELGIGFSESLVSPDIEAFDPSTGVRILLDGKIFSCSDPEYEKAIKEDASLILNLYLRYKENFLLKIDGSFSLALYDQKKGKLILARDRFGTKPLFYFVSKNAVLFGSEIKMILESRLLEKRVNLNAMDSLLSHGYVPSPLTMFQEILQVKPGHLVVVDRNVLSERMYWRFRYNPIRRKESAEILAEEFLEIFSKAIKRRLNRFPEMGAFLSGGLDTSSVVAIMRQIKGSPFKTFTAGFREEAFNEIEDARIVAEHLDVNFITTVINYEDGFADMLEKIVWHHDSPFEDTSAIPSYWAAKLAKEHADTVLTGDFPDQLIGGSGHQVHALSRERNDGILLRGLRALKANRWIRRIPWKAGSTGFLDKMKRFIYRETFSLEEQRILESMPVPPLLRKCLYTKEFLNASARFDPLDLARTIYGDVEGEGLLDKILYFDILSYASDDLIVKVERMTSAHGLNAFSPFYDMDLVDFVASLPPNMKIRGNETKFIMRQAMRTFLPKHTMNKKKQGFAMPIGEWLVENLADYVRDILLDSRSLNRGYFNKEFMRQMIENFLAGKSDYASGSQSTIICLLTLELWHRLFMDR